MSRNRRRGGRNNRNSDTDTATRTYHPLSEVHFRRIICRSADMKRKMGEVVGLTFLNKGRLLAQLGSVTAMVQVGYDDGTTELLGFTAELDTQTMEVNYGQLRMRHSWHKNPRNHSHADVLDPRDSKDPTVVPGDRPAGEWVRYALDLDAARRDEIHQLHKLPAVPVMPTFWAGCATPGDIPLSHFRDDVLTATVLGVMKFSAEDFNAMSADEQMKLLEGFRDTLFTPPGEAGNDTGLYLIDLGYLMRHDGVLRVFEDFRTMVGERVFNPARDLIGDSPRTLPNVAESAARSCGIDIATFRDDAHPDASLQVKLLDAMRARLCAAHGLSHTFVNSLHDNILLDMIDSLDVEIPLPPFAGQDDGQILNRMRDALQATRPHLLPGCTDEDLLAAARHPAQALYASRLCRPITFRHIRGVPLTFTAGSLNRWDVRADFTVPEDWQPQRRAARPASRNKARHVQQSAPVADSGVSVDAS